MNRRLEMPPLCHICGRFIPWREIGENGPARHVMLTPDSDVSSESWDTLCKVHNTPENRVLAYYERKDSAK